MSVWNDTAYPLMDLLDYVGIVSTIDEDGVVRFSYEELFPVVGPCIHCIAIYPNGMVTSHIKIA